MRHNGRRKGGYKHGNQAQQYDKPSFHNILFGNNLKLDYQPESRDKVLEQIVVYYEMGWI